jgi:hypothetical protein
MGCCGQNRDFAKYANSQPSSNSASSADTSLRFVQRRSIAVRGPITGRRYQFHSGSYTHGMDPRDVVQLLTSGFFERVAG